MIANGQVKPLISITETITEVPYDLPAQAAVFLAAITAPGVWNLPDPTLIIKGILTIVNISGVTLTVESEAPIQVGPNQVYSVTVGSGGAFQAVSYNGSWNALDATSAGFSFPLDVPDGGTGTSTAPLDGQFLLGSGGSYVPAALTAGAGLTATSGAGSLSLGLGVPVSVARGGTGLTTLPALNTVLAGIGSGYAQSPLSLTTAGTGATLISTGAGATLALKSLSAGSNAAFTVTTNDIQIASTASSTTATNEYLTVAGGEALSTTVTESVLAHYTYITTPVVTLGTPAANFVKRVTRADPGCAPMQVRTSRGSFLLGPSLPTSVLLAYENSLWAPKTDIPWFADTLQATISDILVVTAAIDGDGNTMVESDGAGTIRAYVRAGSVWSADGAAFTVTGGIGSPGVGTVLDISADGLTVAAGGPNDNTDQGAVWVFVKSGGVWSQQAKLVATGNTGGANVGSAVALSADGNTLAAGGPNDNSGDGAVWVWTRSGAVWTQAQMLQANDFDAGANVGYQVSISNDGSSIATTAPFDGVSSDIGAVWVFTRGTNSTAWTQVGSKIVYPGGSFMGTNVTLSGAGDLLAFIVYNLAGTNGAVAIYQLYGTGWSLVNTISTSTTLNLDLFAMSKDGRTVILTNSIPGSTCEVFVRGGNFWQQPVGFTISGNYANFAISGDSRTFISWENSTPTLVYV